MQLTSPYRRADLARLAGLALTYALLARIVLDFFSANGVVSMVWPSSGLALAALLIGGRKYWPGIFIGAIAGNMMQGTSIGIAMPIAAGNTLEALACVWMLARTRRFSASLAQARDFLWLGLAGALGSCISALIGIAALLLTGIVTRQAIGQNLLQWWLGNMLGIILVTPLILVWRHPPGNWLRQERMVETMACFGLAFISGQIIFLGWFHDIFSFTARGYWEFLFVAWAAVRFGRHGALLVVVMTAIQMLLGMVLTNSGPTTNQATVDLLNFWLYMLAMSGVGILLALAIDRLKSTEASLLQSRDLFDKISQRVPGVIYQFRQYPDGSSCFPYASEAIEHIFEVTPEQVREDASAAFAALHPEDYDGIVASIAESARTLGLWKHEFRVVLPKQGMCWRLGESQPERLADGSVLWHGFITDITDRKQSDERIRRLSKLYKALSEINQAIVRMELQEELFPLVCRCAVEFGGMKMAWVGQLDQASGLIVPAASHGDWLGYLDGVRVSSQGDVPEGRGPAGTALRENRSIIINDYFTDPMTAPWLEQARKYGWNSATGFPIQRGGQPFAVLCVYHGQINAFDSEAIALLEEMSKDISFALDNFDREMQRKLGEESLRLAASVYEASGEGIMITDADNRIVAVNPAFTTITGYLPEEAVGKNPRIFNSGRHDEAFYRAMWNDINASGHWQGEIWDKRKNGEVYPKWLSINTIFSEDGEVLRRIALFTDNTQKREAEQLIWRQANFDFLTGLPNRQMFHDRLDQDIKKAHRAGLPLALLFIDLDRFKEVNDTLGHDVGDAMLKDAAARLSACVRETDTVARLGGDEFIVILGELDDAGVVERVAQDILRSMAEPFRLENEVVYASASIGITLYPEDATACETLLTNADQAMYAAKQQGRNRYHYFTPAMQRAALSRMRLTGELRGALADDQFRLFYQPIVELDTGAIHKAEALIRWQHPQRGRISPADFISIAEDTGLIVDIGEWVFREAARQASIWRATHHPEFQISINKSPVQFRDESAKYLPWPDQLQQLGQSGQSIVVEMTEGMLMDVSEAINNKLLAFRDTGIQVSLDDFGTGYSSLSYLKKFDIDYLKIDQSFTRNLEPGSDDMALCEAIIVMAHKLGMKVIAEGVETEQQRDLLLAAGCDYGQGYLFSRPVPADQFEALLRRV
ncbi:cyclic di-GMP phosphodiesterase Gmr [mine drainage metagenome]|uniref:Cyclic di-GMP phosphodiesterase Gmr n=1 Tax=mine drainage metagenome TaxID=410659 RepID=A0A1J5R3J3_9ZZZZ